MAERDEKEMPSPVTEWASPIRSTTRRTASPEAMQQFTAHHKRRARALLAAADAYQRKALHLWTQGDLRSSLWCLYNAIRCIQRALEEVLA